MHILYRNRFGKKNQITIIIKYICKEKARDRGNSPLVIPGGRLPLDVLAPFSFPFSFRKQKTRASSTKTATNTEPKLMPTIAPAEKLLLPSEFSLSESFVLLREPDPEW